MDVRAHFGTGSDGPPGEDILPSQRRAPKERSLRQNSFELIKPQMSTAASHECSGDQAESVNETMSSVYNSSGVNFCSEKGVTFISTKCGGG